MSYTRSTAKCLSLSLKVSCSFKCRRRSFPSWAKEDFVSPIIFAFHWNYPLNSRVPLASGLEVRRPLQIMLARTVDGLLVPHVPGLDPGIDRVHRVRLHDARLQGNPQTYNSLLTSFRARKTGTVKTISTMQERPTSRMTVKAERTRVTSLEGDRLRCWGA